jgi:hypothetical protein
MASNRSSPHHRLLAPSRLASPRPAGEGKGQRKREKLKQTIFLSEKKKQTILFFFFLLSETNNIHRPVREGEREGEDDDNDKQ